jgi:predicted RNA-binding Zn ribbon-like protein
MTAANHHQPLFSLCGGHAALDFVNSLDHRFGAREPLERLTDYAALLRFALDAGLIDARRARRLEQVAAGAAERAVRAARELREALAAALYARVAGRSPPAAAVRTLERHLHRAGRHRELRWQRGARGGALSWDRGRYEVRAELPVWLLAQSAGELLMSETLERVRACDADTCRWLFLDTSRNHTRRWCDMKVCGNRMKARRFQARQEA